MSTRRLCDVDELADPGSKGLVVDLPGEPGVEVFLVRRGDVVRGYRNQCPHTGGPLDWSPDQYLDDEGEHIMCATHAALFRIEDGYCIAGPCRRQSLRAVPLRVRDGAVWLDDPAPE
jgi:nitrite reductase/ring-hydroxylating ferredoxin subunit